LFIGHINSISLSEVKSPKSKIRSFPNVISVPSDRGFSVTSTGGFAAFAQLAFSFPPPGSGLSINSPSVVTTRTCIPAIGSTSPGFAVMCLYFPLESNC